MFDSDQNEAEGFNLEGSCDYIESVLRDGEYDYSWNERVKGDGRYSGVLDRIKLNRAEGYEMVPFIWCVFRNHDELVLDEQNIYALEEEIHGIDAVMKEKIHAELNEFIAKNS